MITVDLLIASFNFCQSDLPCLVAGAIVTLKTWRKILSMTSFVINDSDSSGQLHPGDNSNVSVCPDPCEGSASKTTGPGPTQLSIHLLIDYRLCICLVLYPYFLFFSFCCCHFLCVQWGARPIGLVTFCIPTLYYSKNKFRFRFRSISCSTKSWVGSRE